MASSPPASRMRLGRGVVRLRPARRACRAAPPPPYRCCASAWISSGEVFTRWSAETAPSSAARLAPPRLSNSSAWILSGKPSSRARLQDAARLLQGEGARSRRRRPRKAWRGRGRGAATSLSAPAAWCRRSGRCNRPGRSLNSGAMACAPRKVGAISSGPSPSSASSACSMRSSAAVRKP